MNPIIIGESKAPKLMPDIKYVNPESSLLSFLPYKLPIIEDIVGFNKPVPNVKKINERINKYKLKNGIERNICPNIINIAPKDTVD
ncbi:hypothetical protein AM1H77_04640 [Apilactobacillus micheneri]